MAVGIACGATGLREATELLQPLLGDPVDYVRQVRGHSTSPHIGCWTPGSAEADCTVQTRCLDEEILLDGPLLW